MYLKDEVVHFKFKEDIFNEYVVQKIALPSNDDLETFENLSDFKILKPQEKEGKKSIMFFRSMTFLPLLSTNNILSINSIDLTLIAQSIAATTQSVWDEIKDDEHSVNAEHKEATFSLFSFLWNFYQGLLKLFGVKKFTICISCLS